MTRRPPWWAWAAGAAALVLVASVAVAVVRIATPASDDTATGAVGGDASTPVCGFGGNLVDALVAVRPEKATARALTSWTVGGDGELDGIAVVDDSVVVARSEDDGRSRFLRYSPTGTRESEMTVAIKHEGRWTMADDGSLFLIDSYHGSTREVVHLSPDGKRVGSFDVPKSSETTDRWFDLTGIAWVPDYQGSPALVIGEGEHTVHVLGEDGEVRGSGKGIPSDIIGRAGDHGIAASGAGSSGTAALEVVDGASGNATLHAVYRADEEKPDQDVDRIGIPTTPAPETVDAVVPGPRGDGFLVAGRSGVQWIDGRGVQKGVLLSGQNALSGSTAVGLAQHDDRYWMLIDDSEKHVQRVATLTAADMTSRIREPLTGTTDVASGLARLGLGIGPVTTVPFNYFDAGTTPEVALRAESGWGELSGAPQPDLSVRYTVRGDPTLAHPVEQEAKTARIPWGGGETALDLPQTRPGAYEIDLRLVDGSDDRVLAGSCLRYSVGSEAAPLDLGSLAAGDDWGGAGPLRGAQLASALGVGSHRIQLDFGSLVPDPEAAPDASALHWRALPGADRSDDPDADPWQEIREASQYAAGHDVRLVVQLGSGGDAEKSAVAAGTWAGWAQLIVHAFAEQAPSITAWSAWNEPNNSSGLSASDYWTTIEIPFAKAAHAANADAFVIAGNTLGFATDWWKAAADAGVCSQVDAIGVHPYTGLNRSWEEEGFERADAGYSDLAGVLGTACDRLPRWDTESGWTADGTIASWDQGSNVARKLLWYAKDRIAGWTYFFSEGGFGEAGLSWSLIQYRSYVKPGGLAFATVSRLLAGRSTPTTVRTGIPFVHAMKVPGDDTMLVAWTDEARMPAKLTSEAGKVSVTDEYGARDEVPLSGGSAEITLTAAPQFFRVGAGAGAGGSLKLSARTAFGPDLLKGQRVSASSTFKDSDPQTITSGTPDPAQPWRSGDGDAQPRVTIPLASPTTIDRIAVTTANISCCDSALRGYTVSVQTADGSWRVVARPRGQFWERTAVFRFDPVEATAVRVETRWIRIRGVRILDLDYTGYAGGPPPPFIGLETKTEYIATISAVSAWAPPGPR